MSRLLIIGTGYVADLYMRSLRLYPEIEIVGCHDRDPARLAQFCAHWDLKAVDSLDALLAAGEPGDVVVNLTNPSSHYVISRMGLEAGFHVYSEKPLAMAMDEARALADLAGEKGLMLSSAPCSFLGEAPQTIWAALRAEAIGPVRLVYAEMDDDFISQAPFAKWASESGAPWPAKDEFEVGCTLEHAGYYLAWLLPMFGPVRTVVAASARLADLSAVTPAPAPDFSVGTLFFESGVVARLTCSILARHDHELRIIGDGGVIELDDCWNNAAPVRLRKRFAVRRRLVNAPFARRLRLPQPTHAKLGRKGSASMNFALGLVELCEAVREDRPCRLSTDLSLHMNEVTLALQNAGEHGGAVAMTTRFDPVAPMPWASALKS